MDTNFQFLEGQILYLDMSSLLLQKLDIDVSILERKIIIPLGDDEKVKDHRLYKEKKKKNVRSMY
jgi:hypothetical protein